MSFFFLALLRLLFFLRVFHVSAPFLFVCSCSGGSSDPCFSLPLSIFKFLISSFRFSPPSLDTRTHLINDPDRSTIHVQTHLQSPQRQFLLAARPPRPRTRRPQAPPPHLPGRLPRPPRPNPRILRRPPLRRPALLPLQRQPHPSSIQSDSPCSSSAPSSSMTFPGSSPIPLPISPAATSPTPPRPSSGPPKTPNRATPSITSS